MPSVRGRKAHEGAPTNHERVGGLLATVNNALVALSELSNQASSPFGPFFGTANYMSALAACLCPFDVLSELLEDRELSGKVANRSALLSSRDFVLGRRLLVGANAKSHLAQAFHPVRSKADHKIGWGRPPSCCSRRERSHDRHVDASAA